MATKAQRKLGWLPVTTGIYLNATQNLMLRRSNTGPNNTPIWHLHIYNLELMTKQRGAPLLASHHSKGHLIQNAQTYLDNWNAHTCQPTHTKPPAENNLDVSLDAKHPST